jgi:hypothetical protein
LKRKKCFQLYIEGSMIYNNDFKEFMAPLVQGGKSQLDDNIRAYVRPLPDKLDGLKEGYGKADLTNELKEIGKIRLIQKSTNNVSDRDGERLQSFIHNILPYLPPTSSNGGRRLTKGSRRLTKGSRRLTKGGRRLTKGSRRLTKGSRRNKRTQRH